MDDRVTVGVVAFADVHTMAIRIEIVIVDAMSLKDKRRVVNSVLDRARNRFGVAAAEVGLVESRDRARLGFATVSSSPRVAEEVLDRVSRYVWSRPDLEVVREEFDVTTLDADP